MQDKQDGNTEPATTATRLRQILLDLARREEDVAFSEAAAVPYWAPYPTSVGGHRAAAAALRAEASSILEATRPS